MKRILSVSLIMCLLFCNLVLSVSAENIDESTFCKYSIVLQNKLSVLQPEDTVNLALWLAYDTTIDYGFTEEDFDDPHIYLEEKREAEKQFHLENNKRYADTLTSEVYMNVNYISKYTPSLLISTTVSNVKKIAESDFVAFIDLLSVEPLDSPTENGTSLYKDRFSSWIGLPEYDPEQYSWSYGTYSDYEELYYHFSTQGSAPDWVLIKVHVDMYNLWERISYKKIGGRVLVSWRPGADAIPYELVVYSTSDETFYDLDSSYVDPEHFNGLEDALSDLELGYQLGDADLNGDVDICDVTVIQRCLAFIDPPAGRMYNEAVSAIGDLDGNGLDIIDATCIQRDLAGMTYPIK